MKNTTAKTIAIIIATLMLMGIISACSGGSRSYSSYSSYSSSSSSTRNGYDMPKSGENFSDYVKRVDPSLYNSMVDQYESAKQKGW